MLPGRTQLTSFPSIPLSYRPYALAFSSIFTKDVHLGVGSFEPTQPNFLEIYRLESDHFVREISHPVRFPQTRICFAPQGSLTAIDSLISTDIHLHMYRLENATLTPTLDLPISEKNDPLTCADWSHTDKTKVITGCVDGTATLVDISTGQIIYCIPAHEHPVYDVSFSNMTSSFVSGGLDGSLRFFDLRALESSLVFYQTSMPIQRLSTSPFEGCLVACLVRGSSRIVVVDTRNPTQAPILCGGGETPATAFAWSRLSPARIHTAHEDCSIYACDIEDAEVEVTFTATSTGLAEAFSAGPMSLAVAADKVIEFIGASEAPPPLVHI
jgi:WD repeat-containing protein 68